MSYDLMVFEKTSAPQNRTDFIRWFEEQTEWTEDYKYDDLALTSAALRRWFVEMIQTFPPLNGPYAAEDVDEPRLTDYCIGKEVIYACFSWSEAALAYVTMKVLAAKHGVGFFNVSTDEGEIVYPSDE